MGNATTPRCKTKSARCASSTAASGPHELGAAGREDGNRRDTPFAITATRLPKPYVVAVGLT